MMRFSALMAIFVAIYQPVMADAPARSIRPDARPGSVVQPLSPARDVLAVLRPQARPVVAKKPVRVVLASAGAAVRVSIRPDARPENLRARTVRAAVRTQPSTAVVTGRQGSVCGDPAIRGQTMSSIPGRIAGCGVKNPVKVTSVDGVVLSTPATVNCNTAKALKKWVKRSLKPAVGRLGGGVNSLRVVAHYACRTRNNQPGGKISEHGRGNAIDIAAINLANGVSLTVLKGWRDQSQGRILKTVHKQACGTFGTVLGPDANRFHQDHFHFDVARHRGGAYCR